MKFNGARRRVCLATSNKEEAAVKARDLYLSIQSRGWEVTLAELTPKQAALTARGQSGSTVGEFLAEVERVSGLKLKTIRRYSQYLRMVVAQTQGIVCDKSRYDYAKGGISRWREKVDAAIARQPEPNAIDGRLKILETAYARSEGAISQAKTDASALAFKVSAGMGIVTLVITIALKFVN